MNNFLRDVTFGEVAVLVAAGTAIWAVLRKIVPAVRKASRLIDDVVGVSESEPGRRDGKPGIMDRLAAVEAQVETLTTIETKVDQISDAAGAAVVQLHPNGGGSLRDQIDALTRGQAKLQELIEERLPTQEGNP